MAIITISRQFGAGGRTLGNRVAERLGYAFVDEEIIQMVAKRAKVSPNWVESIEKEAGGRLLKYITKMIPKSFIDLILDDQRGYIDEEIYVDLLHQIINRLADEGNTVIIGRGSQYILRDRENVSPILLVAQKEDRIKFMEDNYDLSPKEAALVVSRQDKRRTNLYRKFGKEDYETELFHYYESIRNGESDRNLDSGSAFSGAVSG